jgi:tungstate transport system ATP-binding protein
MTRPVLDMSNVRVFRQARLVLDIERFALASGDLAAIIGPNGAGKSSLLQVINLLMPYQHGQMHLFGTDIKDKDMLTLRRRCAMVFQEPLFVQDTVYANVALPLRLRKMSEAEIRYHVIDVLDAFRCTHLAGRNIHCLSGGEAQRIRLARALISQPELLLLDEPFGAVDPALRKTLLAELRGVAQQRGMTVLLVSHSLDEVLHFAHRTIVMSEGRICQDDRPEVVLRRPGNKAVAELVGMDNVIPCRVESHHSDSLIQWDNGIQFVWQGDTLAANVCCLPGDIFKLGGMDAVRHHPTTVSLEGVIRQIVPGIGVYQVIIDVQGLALTIRILREQAIGAIDLGMPIHFTFDSRDAHMV